MLDTIFLRVLDMSKTASIVIAAVLPVRLLLKKAPKIFSYALWAVVLFRLLCPFTPDSSVSVVPELPPASQNYTLAEEPISVFGAGVAAYQAVGDALNGGLGVQHIPTTEKDETGMTRYVTTDWWSVWLLFGQYVWVAGMAAMLLYSAASYRKIRKQCGISVPLRDNIFLADDIHSPFVMGLFRPKIYLPSSLTPQEQVYVLLHEQHHIRRGDHLLKVLAFLALTVHWLNPLVWLAFILAGKDMEMSCDEAVIRRMGSHIRADYAASLLTLATGRRIIAGTPLAFGEGDPKSRIRNLAKWKKPAVWILVLCILVLSVAAVCLLTDRADREPLQKETVLLPGTTYVPYQCLYMNPLSSYAAMGGDSGCKYIVGEDYFATIQRNNGSFVSITHPELETATSGLDGLQNIIEVPKWEWLPFPYTDEEWAELHFPGIWTEERISEQYEEMLYQPLVAGKFLLKMDGVLWLVELHGDPQAGTYLWSIYSLVPEAAMGLAQWEYAPMLSSRLPVFRFAFDMDYTEISAVCTQSPLVDFDAPEKTTDNGLVFQKGNALYWSPANEEFGSVEAAIIHFSVHQEDGTAQSGTIYIEGGGLSGGRRIYTATLVGTGLHLDPNPDGEGGVISAAAQPHVTVHDLTTGDLVVSAEDLERCVFYTNTTGISVSVSGEEVSGTVHLLDISQNNARILQFHVDNKNKTCRFTHLTSARLYRIEWEGQKDCTLTVSGR